MSKNGHLVPYVTETTQNVAPGDSYEIGFTADDPGTWIFHLHVPHLTANKMIAGSHGAPVGMTPVFHYQGFALVPPRYHTYSG